MCVCVCCTQSFGAPHPIVYPLVFPLATLFAGHPTGLPTRMVLSSPTPPKSPRNPLLSVAKAPRTSKSEEVQPAPTACDRPI